MVDISIILLVYNHEKYIRKTLDSILAQKTDYHYEVLVGEDCSQDGSKNILKEYEKSNPGIFRVFYNKKNLGGTKNAYKLLMNARGRYIATIEGDDYWTDERKLQKQADFLDKNDRYIGVAGNFSKIDEAGNLLESKCISKKWLSHTFKWKNFLEYGFLFQTATVMYRNIYRDGGDYTILYKAHDLVGDLTVMTILLNRGNFFILPDDFSAYRYVVSPDVGNAASIAARDAALAIMKTMRQCAKLEPYLRNGRDYDEKIAALKADFLVKWLKRKKGYTARRWMAVKRIGNRQTNTKAVLYAIRAFGLRIFKKR